MSKKLDKKVLFACICGVFLFLALGGWQLQRLVWKQGLIQDLAERSGLPAISLTDFELNKQGEFTHIALQGNFLPDDFFLLNRSISGKSGLNWLKIFADESGKNILVNRGWLPFDLKDVKKPSSDSITALNAIVRIARGQARFVPDNVPAENIWFFIDLPAFSALTGVTLQTDYYLLAGENNQGLNYPIAYDWEFNIPNDHFQYALTWFCFALITLVMGIIYQRHHIRQHSE